MIQPATFNFLKNLKENNNRDWFQEHKEEHDAARENVLAFVGKLTAELAKADPKIPADLDPKNCVMRIYRDIRFSKDKTPYKNNFGAGISENGKSFKGPGYYLHISSGESFLAGGCWMPEADQLKAIRQEIDYNGAEFKKIVENATFKKYFGELDNEAKLKTMPKGYPPDHPDIEYLKLKSFTITRVIKQTELTDKKALQTVAEIFKHMYPFMVFLRKATE